MKRALICLAVGYSCGCFLSAAFAVVIPAVFILPAALTAGPLAGWIAASLTGLAVFANWKSLVQIKRGDEPKVDVIGLIREKIKQK